MTRRSAAEQKLARLSMDAFNRAHRQLFESRDGRNSFFEFVTAGDGEAVAVALHGHPQRNLKVRFACPSRHGEPNAGIADRRGPAAIDHGPFLVMPSTVCPYRIRRTACWGEVTREHAPVRERAIELVFACTT